MEHLPLFLCTKSKQGQITPQIQVTGLPALSLSAPLVIVNNYSEFQVDTFDRENDSHEKLNQRRRRRSSEDNNSNFFSSKSLAKNTSANRFYGIYYTCTLKLMAY